MRTTVAEARALLLGPRGLRVSLHACLVGRPRGGDQPTTRSCVGTPLGLVGLISGGHRRITGGFEVVDIGVELRELELEVEVAGGIEGEHGVVLDDDARWFGEALDVEDGEADALGRELENRGIGLAAPEAVEAIRGEGTDVAVGVEVERVTTIELNIHGGLH